MSNKTVNMRYIRFLKPSHKYRGKLFYMMYDNKPETESAPDRHKNGHHVFEMVKNIQVVFDKSWKGRQGIEVHP